MAAEDPLIVIDEFIARANDVSGVHSISLVSVSQFKATVPRPTNPTSESSLFLGHGDPNTPDGFAYQRWRFDDLDENLGPDGLVWRTLGQQWLVLIASLWNDEFRGRLAAAKGIEKNDVLDPVLADINRMRNDVVHHRGVATAKNSGRCEELRWFAPGQAIHIYPMHVAAFMDYLGATLASDDIGGGPWVRKADF
jgi:hypothetical protein